MASFLAKDEMNYQLEIIKAIIVIMEEGLRHLRLFAACTFVEEELLSIVG